MTAPRIVRDMPEADYHALKALSASGVWALTDIAEGCPAKFWLQSPWNPDREPVNALHFDIGSAAHIATLEPARAAEMVVVHGHDDYRTKEARAARDDAYAAGKIPLKPAEWAQVQRIREAIMADPLARGAFEGDGESEVTALWDDWDYPEVACKARCDRMLDGGRILVDLKTARSAHPIGFARTIWDYGYFSRAAFYLDGFEMATGRRAEEYWFVVCEKTEPHLVAVHKLPERDIEFGRIINRMAVKMFSECMASGVWPGYRPPGAKGPRAFVTGLPVWATYQLHDLLQEPEIKRSLSKDDLRRAREFLEP